MANELSEGKALPKPARGEEHLTASQVLVRGRRTPPTIVSVIFLYHSCHLVGGKYTQFTVYAAGYNALSSAIASLNIHQSLFQFFIAAKHLFIQGDAK